MAEPFLGEIRVFSFDFNPRGWAICVGQLLPINQNQALFSLLGTSYGGDGRTTFALPNLQDRTMGGAGTGQGLTPRFVGEVDGTEAVTLVAVELPAHNHGIAATAHVADSTSPEHYATPNVDPRSRNLYAAASDGTQFATKLAGDSQAHENEQPYTVLTPCIALSGIFPSRS